MALPGFNGLVTGLGALYLLFLMIQFHISAKKLGDTFELLWVPLFDLLYVLYLSGFGLISLIRKRIPWI